MERLEETIRRHANRSRLWDNQSSNYLSNYQRDLNGRRADYLELLEKRITEADAYLQLMIEQIMVLGELGEESTWISSIFFLLFLIFFLFFF